MGARINPNWADRIRERIANGDTIDEIISFNQASQWLIESLLRANKTFKVYNLGAGVKRITTVTDACPCCKRPL